MNRIVRREEMAGGRMVLNEIEAPKIARVAQPGQFVMLRANESGERVPMTISDINPGKGTITIIFSVAGWSTALFKTLQVGDSYENVVGPLGRPTEVEAVGTAICVGGGTGVAVLYPIAKKLKNEGSRVISIIGARNEELIILREEMEAVSDELLVCTDTGTTERNALVTDLLAEVLERETPDVVVAIGPVPMMKRVKRDHKTSRDQDHSQPESHHDRWHGMCGSCRVEVDGQMRLACVEGPEFDGHKVNFDLLMERLHSYRDEEMQALEVHGITEIHQCKMEEEARKKEREMVLE